MRLLRLAAATCVLALAACGTTGSLKSESPEARRQIADYDQVVVLDLAANDLRPARDDVESAARPRQPGGRSSPRSYGLEGVERRRHSPRPRRRRAGANPSK